VFGIHDHPEAGRITYFGLYALQHRGQESAGIAVAKNRCISAHVGMGLVADVFKKNHLETLNGGSAVGHVRYSTTGGSTLVNAQPLTVHFMGNDYALAHNGNLVNAHILKQELEQEGSIFRSTMDSELALHIFIKNLKFGFEQALLNMVARLRGAYAFVLLTGRGEVVGIKDPNGLRPLCLGRLNGHYVLASESCALDLLQAEFVRELEPGEIVIIDDTGLRSLFCGQPRQRTFCIFEYIYFARPDSTIYGRNVYQARKAQGRQLAREAPAAADLVMPFPDSGNYAALGFCEESGLPYEIAMIRNHYIGRTFIQPTQHMRDFGVRVKLNPVKELLKGKEIIIIEDSIIRGTTARTRIKALRELGVKKIHMRVSCPPHRFPCYYGIDFSTRGELIAATMSIRELQAYIGLDSLHYLSLEGLLESTTDGHDEEKKLFCTACFDGCYPVPVEAGVSKGCLE